ncbi:RAMP superfamily CRISPR-associated protein [Synechococcus sp. RC10B2]|uniref:RAMP superfamily CRISPR-associated protein n=1 Tax=Synechococcus sp. RC10B2 TaxID=2964530 RepID=UPI0039C5C1E4
MNGEKPYDFVPFPKRRPNREKGVGQDKLNPCLLSGTLELTLHTLTPVHVGLGYSDFIKAGDQEYLAALQASKPIREEGTTRRRYLIPGSSLKGAVRSIVEAITRSCIRITQGRHRPYIPQGYGGCMSVNDLCIACRLFGAQDYQGHVSFEDAVAPRGSLVLLGTPLLWTPARGGRGLPPRYLQGNQARGRKFYRHARPPSGVDPRACIKSGAELPLRIHFLNLSEAELGVLLTALGQHPDHPFPIKLGGGKPVGLGSVQVKCQRINLLQGADALKATGRLGQSQTLVGDALDKFTTRCAQAADKLDKLIDGDALGKLKTILKEAGLQETAPADPY